MKITTKGQVTIPHHLRLKFGLLPHTDVTFEEADGCVVIRPVLSKRALVEARLREARGVAGAGTTTDDVMRLTRGDD
jgi:AbrB family looped-hinge helix DNA binding protein